MSTSEEVQKEVAKLTTQHRGGDEQPDAERLYAMLLEQIEAGNYSNVTSILVFEEAARILHQYPNKEVANKVFQTLVANSTFSVIEHTAKQLFDLIDFPAAKTATASNTSSRIKSFIEDQLVASQTKAARVPEGAEAQTTKAVA